VQDIGRLYDQIAQTYDSLYVHRLDHNENVLISEMLCGFTHGRVLDLGCGTGLALSLNGIEPKRYLGIDISRGMITRAKEKYPDASFRLADMVSVPIPDQSIDSIISLFGPFSYVEKPIWAVAEISRLLRPGGTFFIMAYGLGHTHKKGYCLYQHSVRRLLYTTESLRDLFKWEFTDIETYPFSFRSLPILHPSLYKRIERFLRPWKAGASFIIITGRKEL